MLFRNTRPIQPDSLDYGGINYSFFFFFDWTGLASWQTVRIVSDPDEFFSCFIPGVYNHCIARKITHLTNNVIKII